MPPSLINLNLNKTIESKKGLVKNKSDNKIRSFEAKNFDFEKETNRVIEKMKIKIEKNWDLMKLLKKKEY